METQNTEVKVVETPAPAPAPAPQTTVVVNVAAPVAAESRFDGRLIGLIGINILTAFVTLITLTLLYPSMVCMKQRWLAKHTIIDGVRLTFDGKGIQLFGNYIKWFLLSIITLGIYTFWLGIKMKQWVVKHTHRQVA